MRDLLDAAEWLFVGGAACLGAFALLVWWPAVFLVLAAVLFTAAYATWKDSA